MKPPGLQDFQIEQPLCLQPIQQFQQAVVVKTSAGMSRFP
jgi:hypothetical protein